MTNKFSSKQAKEIVNALSYSDDAFIDFSQANAPRIIRRVDLDLSVARTGGNPYKAGFSFKSVYVYQATDSASEVNFQPFTDDDGDKFPLRKNGVLNFDFPVKNGFFTWDAQSGKTISLIFLLNGSFRSGSTLTEVSSSVDGNSISNPSPVTLTGALTQVVAQDLNRKILNIYSSAPWRMAGSISSTNTFPMPAGWSKISNTAAIFGIGAGTVLDLLQEE